MSIIEQRDVTSGFTFGDAASYGAAGSEPGAPAAALPTSRDAIRALASWSPPYQSGPSYSTGAPYGSGAASTGGFGTFVSELVAAMQNALASLSQMFSGGGTLPGSSGNGERFMRSATADSVGDPHDSVHGTAGNGVSVSQTWDSMSGHGDLLDSDSFDGGYQVATTVTQPNAKGVTLNASATVSAQSGESSVTFNGDGTYGITANGSSVALQRGQSISLGNGERVTVNEDSSLTVSDRNASGGTISTTMRANRDGGVDVTNSANNVDLGGYLVSWSDAPTIVPLQAQPTTFAPYAPHTTYDGSAIELA